jgi:hypothetical protein
VLGVGNCGESMEGDAGSAKESTIWGIGPATTVADGGSTSATEDGWQIIRRVSL